MLRKIFLASAILTSFGASAYTVETIKVEAPTTGISKEATVVLPSTYTKDTKYPVVYLLHGHGGNYRDWTNLTNVETLADRYNMIVVMPDGNQDSWYIDSKIKKNSNYATYIAKDVVNFIDSKYSTIESKDGRGITGLSMGGFGAMSIGFDNLDTFGAIGAISGGVDFTPFPQNWRISDVLGDYNKNQADWHEKTIINNLQKVADYTSDGKDNNYIPIAFEVGVNDFFIDVNRKLHQEMLRLNIRHDYTERQGQHDWIYWNNAISYQMQFMNDALRKQGAFTRSSS